MWPTAAPLLADKSAWVRIGHYADDWLEALNADRIVSCAVSHLELLYSARTRADVEQLDADLAHLRDIPITRGTLVAAKRAMLDLAARGSDGHASRASAGRDHRGLRRGARLRRAALRRPLRPPG